MRPTPEDIHGEGGGLFEFILFLIILYPYILGMLTVLTFFRGGQRGELSSRAWEITKIAATVGFFGVPFVGIFSCAALAILLNILLAIGAISELPHSDWVTWLLACIVGIGFLYLNKLIWIASGPETKVEAG